MAITALSSTRFDWLSRLATGLAVASLGLGAAAGCTTGEPAPALRQRGAPIIGGAPSDDAAVVLLVSYPPDRDTFYTCSAVLYADRSLLTAAHCVAAASHPGHTFGAFLGADATAYATVDDIEPDLVPVTDVAAHPDYETDAPFHADLGFARLAESIDGVEPLPLLRTAPDDLVGEPARIIGYGQTVYNTYNASRHAATTVVASIDEDDSIVVGDDAARTCLGDSGGPALVEIDGVETIVGVDSYTDVGGCTAPAHFRRVDLYLDFLDEHATPPEPDAGVEAADAGADSPDASSGAPDDDGGCDAGGGAAGRFAPALLALVAVVLHRRRPVSFTTR